MTDIKEIEENLLKNELEKQNLILEMKPVNKEIDILRYSLKKLEQEKHFMESTKIHQISQQEQMISEQNILDNKDKNQVIDTDITS